MDRLDELSVFLAILDAGGLAEAGRRLRRSAPAVTRSLAALEDRLGVRLLERTTRRLAPTDAGLRLAEQARRLLADYDEAVRTADAEAPVRGRLRITAPVVFGRRHVTPLVIAFLRAYPDVTVDAQFSDRNLDLIDEGIDVAARIGPLADSSLTARRVGWVRRQLAASPEYLAARGAPDTVEALAAHDLIFTAIRPTAPEWRLIVAGRERILRFAPRLTVNQVEASLEAARAGLGIVRALSYQLTDDFAAGRLVLVAPETEAPPLPVHLLAVGGRHRPARAQTFMDFAAAWLMRAPELQGSVA